MKTSTRIVALMGAGFGALATLAWTAGDGRPLPDQVIRKQVLPGTHWVTVDWHNDEGGTARYATTSDPRDLDNAVRFGAKILKFRDGTYVRTIHKQYGAVCGPASLAIVLKQLGISDPVSTPKPGTIMAPRRHVLMPRDVDREGSEMVDVGYAGSMEHLMWLGYHRRRLNIDGFNWNAGRPDFMDRDGVLVTRPAVQKTRFDGNKLDYYAGEFIPSWMTRGPAVGYWDGADTYTGLTGIMNYIFSGGRNGPWRDAIPLSMPGNTDAQVVAYRRIVKGFIDHGISVACGVEDGGHFNALIGYRGAVSPASATFYVYTADPLDGWGRDPDNQPLTWRRIPLTRENLGANLKLFVSIICWNHHAEGGADVQFRPGDWAQSVDRANGNTWLTGPERQPTVRDPLNDPLERPLERR